MRGIESYPLMYRGRDYYKGSDISHEGGSDYFTVAQGEAYLTRLGIDLDTCGYGFVVTRGIEPVLVNKQGVAR